MLVNLTELFASEAGRKEKREISSELEVFSNGAETYQILRKTPVTFLFTNLAAGRCVWKGRRRLYWRCSAAGA